MNKERKSPVIAIENVHIFYLLVLLPATFVECELSNLELTLANWMQKLKRSRKEGSAITDTESRNGRP